MVTAFEQRVYDLLISVPAGRVTTYKEIGNALGKDGNIYRAIGQALHKNPFAPRVPCHRVVRADGSLGGFAYGSDAKIALLPALKFGAFFVFILFIEKLLQTLLGSSGIYVAALLAGLADVDAITISMLTFASTGEVSISVAVTAITLAVASNTLTKCAIASIFGSRTFAKQVAVCTAIILSSGLLAILVL